MNEALPIADAVARALSEDLGDGDVTTAATVSADARASALINQKAPGVVFGLEVAAETFRALDPGVEIEPLAREGEWRESGEVMRIEGRARALLSAERTALNFLQRLSGVATMAARCVAAIDGTGARILDTRKTTPGLRDLEKHAVRCGGGTNHRFRLDDGVLIKDNHLRLAGSIGDAIARARATALPVEVECDTLGQVGEALAAGADRILLDNMSLDELREAVSLTAGRAELEASGGVTLDTVRAIAETGVDFISVGALTHSAPALDVSLEVL